MVLKPLSQIKPGETGTVVRLDTPDEASLKLMELGINPGEPITYLRQAPFGGPVEIELMGYRLSIRRSDADKIVMESRTGS